jgi:hypothetical protein
MLSLFILALPTEALNNRGAFSEEATEAFLRKILESEG